MLSESWRWIEADFQRFYGLDLRAEFSSPKTTPRRLWALICALPADAALHRANPPKPDNVVSISEFVAREKRHLKTA